MTDTQSQLQHPSVQGLRVRDPQYRDLYSNSSQTQLGPFDITLLFQKSTEVLPGQIGQIDLVSITLSPQHFKGLVRSLNETLSAFESMFGALTIPDTDTAPIRNASEIVEIMKEARARATPAPTSTPSSAEPAPAERISPSPRKKARQP